jgi:mono/diheme cytochrome c family protein
MLTRVSIATTALACAALLGAVALARAQHGPGHGAGHGAGHGGAAPTAAAPTRPAPVRITAEELHRIGGTPPGWRFTVPPGDPKKGRDVFVKLECQQCHEVKGETFPPVPKDPKRVGPELTGMGSHHPTEYLAESILAPNAVIVTAPGHTGDDGLSIMPDFTDSLTVAEWVNLVAYLMSLTDPRHGGGHAAARERVIGDYRIRVAYHGREAARGAHGHGAPAHGAGHGHGAPPAGHGHGGPAKAAGHLVVFVTDARTGDAVPYLPVTATIHADKGAPRMVKLAPMVGGQGFHYGADVELSERTTRVVLAVGPTTMRVMPSAAGRFAKRETVTFDWR